MSLDPRTNRHQREVQAQTDAEPPPLEPDFPWVKESFDPIFFGLDRAVDTRIAGSE